MAVNGGPVAYIDQVFRGGPAGNGGSLGLTAAGLSVGSQSSALKASTGR